MPLPEKVDVLVDEERKDEILVGGEGKDEKDEKGTRIRERYGPYINLSGPMCFLPPFIPILCQ